LLLLQVSTNGVLQLMSGSGAVYAFSADADTTSIGHVFYKETTDSEILTRINDLSDAAFPNTTSLNYAFIATWFYVGYDNNNDDLVSQFNEFFCELASEFSSF